MYGLHQKASRLVQAFKPLLVEELRAAMQQARSTPLLATPSANALLSIADMCCLLGHKFAGLRCVRTTGLHAQQITYGRSWMQAHEQLAGLVKKGSSPRSVQLSVEQVSRHSHLHSLTLSAASGEMYARTAASNKHADMQTCRSGVIFLRPLILGVRQ